MIYYSAEVFVKYSIEQRIPKSTKPVFQGMAIGAVLLAIFAAFVFWM
jgi:uncharacterized protein (DUF2062 family)